MPPPPKSPSRFTGGTGDCAGPADHAERAGDGDVVNVVPGGERERPVLAPAGHAAEDEAGVALRARLRAEAEPLGDAGPEALDQHVGLVGQPEQQVDRRRVLEVQADRAAPAAQRIERCLRLRAASLSPVDSQDIGAEIGQDHAAEGRGRQAGDLDDTHAAEWTHVASAPVTDRT